MPWNYIGTCAPERRAALYEPLPFSHVVERLAAEMEVLCYHYEPKHNDQTFHRAVYCAKIEPMLFDAFFNSSLGYRGAYFESPGAGLEANWFLIDSLKQGLMCWMDTQGYSHDDIGWAAESLDLDSAKAWLVEPPMLCRECEGEWSIAYQSNLIIQNDRWERPNEHSEWGRQAPWLNKIRIFGGFLDSQHHEWIADHEVARAEHISMYGWS